MERLAQTRDNFSDFCELVFGTSAHAGQRRYVNNAHADLNFLLPGNSFGKTELMMRFAIWMGWFKKGAYEPTNAVEWLEQEYKVLLCSYSHGIAKESFDRFMLYHTNREELRILVKDILRSEPFKVTLNNGTILDWGSLDGQGKSVEAARRRLILVDEAGHIPDLKGTYDNILYPRTMGVGGQVHLFGTPKAHSDPYLLEVYEKGLDGKDPFYYSQSGSVMENEFWPQEEKDRVLRNPQYVIGWEDCDCPGECEVLEARNGQHPILTTIGKQVIRGAFVQAAGFFFNRMHVARMFSGEFPDVEWYGDIHFHEEPKEGHLYLGAFDLGGNRRPRKGKKGSDATVGFVIDYTERPYRIVRYDYIEGGSADWQQKYDLMAEVFKTYGMMYLLIDGTGQVDTVEEALYDRGVDVESVHFGGVSSKKFNMLRALQLSTELEWEGTRGLLRSPLVPRLKREMDYYVLPDDDIVQDHVMALAMLVNHVIEVDLPSFVATEVF